MIACLLMVVVCKDKIIGTNKVTSMSNNKNNKANIKDWVVLTVLTVPILLTPNS